VSEPTARSPFLASVPPGPSGAEWRRRATQHGALTLEDVSGLPRWQIHGKSATRLTEAQRYRPGQIQQQGALLYWSFAPSSWYVAARAGFDPQVPDVTGSPTPMDGWSPALKSFTPDLDEDDTTCLTHAVATARLRGDGVAQVLAQICPLDLRSLGPARALRTTMAQVTTEVLRPGDDTGYVLSVSASFGTYFWSVLDQAFDDLDAKSPATRQQ
jgi:hypothetical protein